MNVIQVRGEFGEFLMTMMSINHISIHLLMGVVNNLATGTMW